MKSTYVFTGKVGKPGQHKRYVTLAIKANNMAEAQEKWTKMTDGALIMDIDIRS